MFKPMMAHPAKSDEVLSDPKFLAEAKYDAHRGILKIGGGKLQLWSRLGKDRTEDVAFLWPIANEIASVVLDGELVVPGGTSSDVVDLSNKDRLVFVAFDLLAGPFLVTGVVTGDEFYREPFEARRERLAVLVMAIDHPRLLLSRASEDGVRLYREVSEAGGEGVIMKRKDAPYEPGKRSWTWQKMKVQSTWDVVVTGCDAEPTQWTVRPGHHGTDGVFYPEGKPSSTKLAGYVGLTYGWYIDGELKTVGKLGYTGPREELEPLVGRVAEVQGWGLYKTGAIRHPGVIRFRDDKVPEECVLEDSMVTLRNGGAWCLE